MQSCSAAELSPGRKLGLSIGHQSPPLCHLRRGIRCRGKGTDWTVGRWRLSARKTVPVPRTL